MEVLRHQESSSKHIQGMKEAHSKIISIEDTDVTSFKALLQFIYSGEIPEDLASSPETYLLLAEKYDMQDLKDCCSLALAKNLACENVVDTLIRADLFRCPDLKRECIRRLREWKAVLTADAMEPLKRHPELLMELLIAY